MKKMQSKVQKRKEMVRGKRERSSQAAKQSGICETRHKK